VKFTSAGDGLTALTYRRRTGWLFEWWIPDGAFPRRRNRNIYSKTEFLRGAARGIRVETGRAVDCPTADWVTGGRGT